MLLVGYSFTDVLLGILYVSLVLLVLVISYKKLLKKFSKDALVTKDYCVLYSLEKSPASGELEFYFTSEIEREVKLSILDSNLNEIKLIIDKIATSGGNIVRFDSTLVSNGEYYYCLKTENQKTMKKMRVLNL